MRKTHKLFALSLLVSCLLCGCGNGDGTDLTQGTEETPAAESSTASPTESPTEAPTEEPTETPTTEPVTPAEPYDSEGNVIAMYGSPVLDGEIDDIWDIAGELVPEIYSSEAVGASATVKVLWDESCLYTLALVTDTVLNDASANAYEQDSLEVFLDELYDQATSYASDDVQYRVNYKNKTSNDHGDAARFASATKPLLDEDGDTIGYVVETAISFLETPQNDLLMGFEVQINDAGAQGSRVGTVNLFDASGSAWSDPSKMGSLILKGKVGGETVVTKKRLETLLATMDATDFSIYANADIMTKPLEEGRSILSKADATQDEIDAAVKAIQDAFAQLNDGSGFTAPRDLPLTTEIADPFLMLDGTAITNPEEWAKRSEEISRMYQYYMYGVWRDGSDEEVTYNLNGNKLTIYVKRISTGATASFTATVQIPSGTAPEGGFPVLVGMHEGISEGTALANGIATITVDGYSYPVATDDMSRTGAFYTLYPYGDTWEEQTGVLMAWAWGCSKVLDALEAGADAELGIHTENSIITGVSRWGKAAMVCGAFEKRFKMVAPSCSGAGGTALFRYTSEGKTYDFSSKGASNAYTYTQNEPLGSLQSTSEAGWFNDNFLKFSSPQQLPFDQHLLCSLVAEDDRYLFVIGSCVYEDWVNAPSMWFSYLATQKIYDFLGLGDHLAINIHREGHAVIAEDIEYMAAYFKEMVYGETATDVNLDNLKTSVFALDINKDPIWETFAEHWTIK